MGFSLVAAAAIIGFSVIMAIEIVVSTTVPTIIDVHNALDDMKERAIDQIQTSVNITDVTSEVNGSNFDINITVKNIGSITLKTTYFNILVNGTDKSFSCSKIYIHPENEVYFNVSNIQDTGNLRLKVITNNGISDYYDFNLT
jgi:flagellar protein FlaF